MIQPSSVCRTNATHEHSHGRPDQSHTFGPRRWPAQIEPHSEEIKPSPTKVRLDLEAPSFGPGLPLVRSDHSALVNLIGAYHEDGIIAHAKFEGLFHPSVQRVKAPPRGDVVRQQGLSRSVHGTTFAKQGPSAACSSTSVVSWQRLKKKKRGTEDCAAIADLVSIWRQQEQA